MGELWELLCSAQENIGGIPAKFVEQKKEEIKKRQVFYEFCQLVRNKEIVFRNTNILVCFLFIKSTSLCFFKKLYKLKAYLKRY